MNTPKANTMVESEMGVPTLFDLPSMQREEQAV